MSRISRGTHLRETPNISSERKALLGEVVASTNIAEIMDVFSGFCIFREKYPKNTKHITELYTALFKKYQKITEVEPEGMPRQSRLRTEI